MRWTLLLLFGFANCQPTSDPPLQAFSVEVPPPPPPEPPAPVIDYDTTEWTDLAILEPSLVVDMRYATDSNFMEMTVYDCGRCLLRPEVARAVVAAHRELRSEGLGLKLWDCYRPRPVQWKLWNKTPDPRFVSDPRKGSMHNRGAAVDLTLVDAEGRELDMGTPYDYFGPEGYSLYADLPEKTLTNRTRLRELMTRHGLRHIRTEWWHYAFRGGSRFALSDYLWNCPETTDSDG